MGQISILCDLDEDRLETGNIWDTVEGVCFLLGLGWMLTAGHVVPDLASLYSATFTFPHIPGGSVTVAASASDNRQAWPPRKDINQQPSGTSSNETDIVLIRLPGLAQQLPVSLQLFNPVFAKEVMQQPDTQCFWISQQPIPEAAASAHNVLSRASSTRQSWS